MRNTTEFTRGYQLWAMIRREFIGVCICAFVQFLLFIPSYSNNTFRIISGVLFSIVNFVIIYDGSYLLGKLDRKNYTPLEYDIKWSVLWGVVIALINLVLIGLFKLNWHLGAPLSMVFNIVFYIFEAPYYAFLIFKPETVPIVVMATSVLIPVFASVAGYLSAKTNFSLSEKIRNLMFENGNKDA